MQSNKIVAKYLAQKSNQSAVNVRLNAEGFVDILSCDGKTTPRIYKSSFVPNLASFLTDDSVSYKIIMGAYGSGKTSGLVNAILREAVLMPPCDDGIRRYKVAFIRNTAGQLETTTLTTWLYWTQGLPSPSRNKKPQLTYAYKFNDEEGAIYLEVLFLALDRDSDVSKLDSLELTSAVFNELRHIPKRIFDTVLSRIGRYPAKLEFVNRFYEYIDITEAEEAEELKEVDELFQAWNPYKKKVFADTNPPKVRHWIAELEQTKMRNLKVYHQPPALIKNEKGEWIVNSKADNLLFVGNDYYLDMIDRGEEFIKVYGRGEYGTVVDGKPVYPAYNDDLHSVNEIEINMDSPIYIGCDYGITCPACILCQFVGAQIKFIKEFIGEYESIKSLWQAAIIPFINLNCRGLPIVVVGDPADTASGRQQLGELGFQPEIARTNKVESRIAGVTNVLNILIGGKPRIVVSKQGCPILREGFLGEYHYRRLKVIGEDKYVDSPNKTHPYSDIHDAAQYIVTKICDEIGLNMQDDTHSRHRFNMNYQEKTKSTITGY